MQQEHGPNDCKTLIAGVDGGGTKTSAWLAYIDGRNDAADRYTVIGRGQAGGSNATSIGVASSCFAIHEALREAFSDAGVSEQHIDVCVAAVAGTGREQVRAALEQSLQDALVAKRVVVTDDVSPVRYVGLDQLERRAIEPVYPVVVLAAGTGSIAWGFNADGKRVRAGGHGPATGDPGSGYAIGRGILEVGLLELDQPARTGKAHTKDEIASIAQLAKAALHCYPNDDAIRRIIEHAAEDLASMVQDVVQQISGIQSKLITLVTTGGVLTQTDIVVLLVLDQLARSGLQIAHHIAVPEPVTGALLLAAELAKNPA